MRIRTNSFTIVGLYSVGLALIIATNAAKAGHPMESENSHQGRHVNFLEWDGAGSPPKVDLIVVPDPDTGYNLRVSATGFQFSPQNVGRKHRPGEGHAHVYINGKKIGRLYSEWMHIPKLPSGEVNVEVALSTNDHQTYVARGKVIKGVVQLVSQSPPATVPEEVARTCD